MASYTTLVNIDTDPVNLIKDVAGLLAEGERAAFEQRAEELVSRGSAGELVVEFLKYIEVIVGIDGDDRVQGFFEGIFSVIYTLTENSQESVALIRTIVERITANKTSGLERRLNALVVLLNLTFEVPSKLEAIYAIFNYAMDTGLIEHVAHFHTHINDWIITWKLDAEQQRKLLRIASQALLRGNSSAQAQALRLNIRYFQTFKNEAISPEVDSLMKSSVISAINSPVDAFGDRCALLEAFHGLRLNQQWSQLVQLLKIICDGSLDDFITFKTNNRNVLVDNKLDEAALEQNIRLLTLTSLAANASNRVVSFQSINSALKVTLDEVELWVIEAIAHNLINGSIDQVNSSVTITHFVHRSFGPAQWKQLQQRLRELRKSVIPVVAAINSTNLGMKNV